MRTQRVGCTLNSPRAVAPSRQPALYVLDGTVCQHGRCWQWDGSKSTGSGVAGGACNQQAHHLAFPVEDGCTRVATEGIGCGQKIPLSQRELSSRWCIPQPRNPPHDLGGEPVETRTVPAPEEPRTPASAYTRFQCPPFCPPDGARAARRLPGMTSNQPSKRGPLRFVWIAAAAAAFLTACGGDASTGTIEGTVTPANALPTVLVLADGDVIAVARPNVTTGAFHVDVPPGTYDVTVAAEGFLPNDGVSGVSVRAGAVASLGAIALLRAGTGSIAGHVEPADADATVSALQFGAVIASGPLDAEGDFLLTSLPVGTYELSVSAPGYARFVVTEGVRVGEGMTTTVDPITLAPSSSPTGSIAGRVAPADIGATVTVSLGGVPAGSASVGTDGAFEISGLTAGTYQLVVSASGYGAVNRSGVVIVGDQITNVGTLTLQVPTRVVAGQVLDLDTRAPVPGVTVTVGNLVDQTGADGRFEIADPPVGLTTLTTERPYYIPGAQLVDVPSEGAVGLSLDLAASGRVRGVVRASGGAGIPGAVVDAGDASASTNGAGEYMLVHLRPGRYEVRARATGYAQAGVIVDVVRGATATADITLPEAGSVHGRVTDASSGVGVGGALVSAGGKTVVADAGGYYELPGVPVGSQTASVSALHYVDATRGVSVPAGGVATLDVALAAVPRVAVMGRVTDSEGAPVVGAWVRFGPSYEFDDSTDANGDYAVPASASDSRVPTDITQVTVSATGYPTAVRAVDLSAGGATATVDVAMDEYATVFGRVVDSATGEGVEGVVVACGGSQYTGPGGSFASATVTPGQVSCYVSTTCYPYQPQYLAVTSGEVREVTVVVTRRADVEVHVRDAASDTAVPGAEVTASGQSVVANASGVATLECLYVGSQTVHAWSVGYSSAATRVLVPESGVVQAFVDLETAE